jgi:hypothetical protein
MRSLLLRSLLLGMLVIPFIAARDPKPMRGLKRAVLYFVAFNIWSMLALRFLYSRLS